MGILSDLFGAGRRRDVSMQGQIDGIISRLALIEVGSTGIGVTPAELAALSAEVAALRDRVATIEADVAQPVPVSRRRTAAVHRELLSAAARWQR